MHAITPESGLAEWGEILRLGLNIERSVSMVVDRATLEGQRLLEEREQRGFHAEDHRAVVRVPLDPDDVVVQANREIVELFEQIDREAAVL